MKKKDEAKGREEMELLSWMNMEQSLEGWRMGRLVEIMKEMFLEADQDAEVEVMVTEEDKDTAPLLEPMEASRQGLARVCWVVLQPFPS